LVATGAAFALTAQGQRLRRSSRRGAGALRHRGSKRFQRLPRRAEESDDASRAVRDYNKLINTFARSGDVVGAERCFDEMVSAGLRPDTVSYSTVVGACARGCELRQGEVWLERMRQSKVKTNEVSYSSLISAYAKRAETSKVEQWLGRMVADGVLPDAVVYNSAIDACASKGDVGGSEDWLLRMAEAKVEADVVSFSAVLRACTRGGRWAEAEHWFERMLSARVEADSVSYNAIINACAQHGHVPRAEQWLEQMLSSRTRADVVSYSSIVKACARRIDADRAEAWLARMLQAAVRANAVTYNGVISACARGDDVERAMWWFEQVRKGGLRPEFTSLVNIRKACARAGDLQRAEEWYECMLRAQGASSRVRSSKRVAVERGPPLFRLDSTGDPATAQHLERALAYQWTYGYPHAPPGERQLTHGIFRYDAGMQAMTAREMLKLAPDARTVLDMFCGSGAVLIEALAAGRRAVGSDASPLAIFVASHHCDAHGVDLDELLRCARRLGAEMPAEVAPNSWQDLRRGVAALPDGPVRDALLFVLMVALQRGVDTRAEVAAPATRAASRFLAVGRRQKDPDDLHARPLFLASAERYAARLRELRASAREPRGVRLHCCDSRRLRLAEPVDAIITGPPYPGVYDYLARARLASAEMSGLGADVFKGLDMASVEREEVEEIGSRRDWRRQSLDEFLKAFQKQQEEWLESAYLNLREGGTATLMIGNGDADDRNGIDCLSSTLNAARANGLQLQQLRARRTPFRA